MNIDKMFHKPGFDISYLDRIKDFTKSILSNTTAKVKEVHVVAMFGEYIAVDIYTKKWSYCMELGQDGSVLAYTSEYDAESCKMPKDTQCIMDLDGLKLCTELLNTCA